MLGVNIRQPTREEVAQFRLYLPEDRGKRLVATDYRLFGRTILSVVKCASC